MTLALRNLALGALAMMLLAGKAGAQGWYRTAPMPWGDPQPGAGAPAMAKPAPARLRAEPLQMSAARAASPAREIAWRERLRPDGLKQPRPRFAGGLAPRIEARHQALSPMPRAEPAGAGSLAGEPGGGWTVSSVHAGGELDLNPGGRLAPYLGAGLGAVHVAFDTDPRLGLPARESQTGFSAKARFGARYRLGARASLYGELSYQLSGPAGTDRLPDDLQAAREGGRIGIGLRLAFAE